MGARGSRRISLMPQCLLVLHRKLETIEYVIMKKRTWILVALLWLSLVACSAKRSRGVGMPENHALSEMPTVTIVEPEYRVAEGYFVAADSIPLVIKSQAELERYLGMATTMDERPTEIDWDKEFVVAIARRETWQAESIKLMQLYAKADTLYLQYETPLQMDTQGFSVRPLLVLILPRAYENHKIHLAPLNVGIAL